MRVTGRFGASTSLVSAVLLALLATIAPSHHAKANCDPAACGRLATDLFTDAAKIAWQIIKSPECSGDIENYLTLAGALLVIENIPNSPVTQGNCTNSFQAIADLAGKNADNPVISKALGFLSSESGAQHYLNCSCPLTSIAADAVREIVKDSHDCSSFSPSDCLGNLYGSFFDKPTLTTWGEFCDATLVCGLGTLQSCMDAHNWIGLTGSCVDNVGQGVICEPGLVVIGDQPVCVTTYPAPGQMSTTCTPSATNPLKCTCPVGQAWQGGDHCAACPVKKTSSDSLSADGQTMTSTTCTQTEYPSDDRLSCKGNVTEECTVNKFNCVAGQKVAWWGQCAPACGAGQVYDSSGQCNTCPANFKTVFASSNNSKGTCEECAANERSLEGSYKCTELTCAPHGYQDPNKPHACILCPGNQFYSPNSRGGGQGPKPKRAGTCGCGEAQVLEGDTCVCAKGANNPPGLTAELACSCPAGSKMDYKTGACVCGIGKHIEIGGGGTANTCVPNGDINKALNPPVLPPGKKLQTPPPKTGKIFTCPPGSHPNPNRAKSCLPDRTGPTEFRPSGPPVFMPQPGGGHVAPGGIRR